MTPTTNNVGYITDRIRFFQANGVSIRSNYTESATRLKVGTQLITYKTLTNQQPTYLYNSLSFPSHSVSTRSSDSLVLSIPYVRSSLGKRAFSVIGPRFWNSLTPDTRNSFSLQIFRSRLNPRTPRGGVMQPPPSVFPL